ncbi:hypothetical protein JCM8097_006568 [Rhodosporidiobolus ruineniae]
MLFRRPHPLPSLHLRHESTASRPFPPTCWIAYSATADTTSTSTSASLPTTRATALYSPPARTCKRSTAASRQSFPPSLPSSRGRTVSSISSSDDHYVEDADLAQIIAALGILTSLKKLTLNFGLNFDSSPLRQTLRDLSIEHLHLGPYSAEGLAAASVLKLIEGSEAIPSLKRLTLDTNSGIRGGSAEALSYNIDAVMDDWEVPDWPDDFTEDDLQRILDVGEEKGVEVDGEAVEALGMVGDYEQELEECEEKRQERRRKLKNSSWWGARRVESSSEESGSDEGYF